jgi:Multidrug resistance efflux pump
MTDESPSQDPSPATDAEAQPGKATRVGASVVLALIAGSLLWYFVADRLTPHTTQARVQAFVVPVAAEVAGKVLAVHVRNNDEVQPGQPLFDIDPEQYRIALQRSRSDLESVRSSVNAAVAGVDAARASLQAAQANQVKAEKDAARHEALYAEDPGAISVRRLEVAQATGSRHAVGQRPPKRSCARPRKRSERPATATPSCAAHARRLKRPKLDLARTKVLAPARGTVTDLRTDVGHFAQAGAPAMTLIANHDLWISADMTENNLGNIDPGDAVAIVLDVLPGEVLKGRVRSVGGGVSSGQQAPTGTLPTIENSRDWLRQAQRFPVAIEFDADEAARLGRVRPGGRPR